MIQTVADVVSDLSRFNPNARVEPVVDVQGVSPATACSILDPKTEELEDEVEKLKRLLSDLRDAVPDTHGHEELLIEVEGVLS